MYGRKVKLRFFFILLILITLTLSVYLILKSLEENVVYFQSPSEINSSVELNFICSFNSCALVIKYKDIKLINVKLNADQT